MQIQLRVRTNDVDDYAMENQLIFNGFILYDNCTEIKYGTRFYSLTKEEFSKVAPQTLVAMRAAKQVVIHPETGKAFDEVIYMVRHIAATEERIAKDPKLRGKSRVNPNEITAEMKETNNYYLHPYHYNVVEWKDRITDKRYRLIFDTVVWINDDSGKTLRKLEG